MHASTIAKMEVEPILVSIPQDCQMIGRGVATMYALIGAGKVKAVKSDGRTLIVVKSLHDYVATLDDAKIAPPRKRPPQRLRNA
jgi:hypothetical protein